MLGVADSAARDPTISNGKRKEKTKCIAEGNENERQCSGSVD
jgi:hypothetical protein